jgi:hypothetical protein
MQEQILTIIVSTRDLLLMLILLLSWFCFGVALCLFLLLISWF